MPLKVCFFIDDLDELDRDYTELCKVLYDMAGSLYIKMCLSSRAWAVFEKSFESDNEKRPDIHELTRNDIRGFVSDQLQTNSQWAHLSREVGNEKTELVEQIASQSDGVFLRAFFVTKSFREDLSSGKIMSDILKHLSDLPRDVDQLFKHMLEKYRLDQPP